MTDQQNIDLARRKWLNPASKERFLRKELELSDGSTSEGLLEDIVHLSDQLFDHLSVLEQFREVTSRGAQADEDRRVDAASVRSRLTVAQSELRKAYAEISRLRATYVSDQIRALSPADERAELKLHLGAGRHRIPGWVNVDAGGGDLSVNVNWGLPFTDESVSFVYAAHLLEHLRYRDQAGVLAREIQRVLKPGGVARFVVPDVGRLLDAYVTKDAEFFAARQKAYPLADQFLVGGVATLDYILLFCGANNQMLNYNHKFGYDAQTLSQLLLDAGFTSTVGSGYQASGHPELRVDSHGYNAPTENRHGEHFSLFVEATK